jgi:hypothetical protein
VQNHAGERRYYQVAWSAAEAETLERELRPLRKIRDNHPKILLTADPDTVTIEGIRKVNVIEWLSGSADPSPALFPPASRGVSRRSL